MLTQSRQLVFPLFDRMRVDETSLGFVDTRWNLFKPIIHLDSLIYELTQGELLRVLLCCHHEFVFSDFLFHLVDETLLNSI